MTKPNDYVLVVKVDGNDADYEYQMEDLSFFSDWQAFSFQEVMRKLLKEYQSKYERNEQFSALRKGWLSLTLEEKELFLFSSSITLGYSVEEVDRMFEDDESLDDIMELFFIPLYCGGWAYEDYPHSINWIDVLKKLTPLS